MQAYSGGNTLANLSGDVQVNNRVLTVSKKLGKQLKQPKHTEDPPQSGYTVLPY